MKIKSQEELEAFAGKTEEDVIAMKAENAGLKKEVGETRAALEVMNKALQNVLEKTAKGSNLDVPKDKRQQVKDALRAMRKHDLKGVFESGAQSVSPAEVESGIWQPTPWNVGADEKTILGSYYLRGDATTGSYLVPVDYAREILDIPKQASVMLGQVTNYPVGARTTYLPVQATKPSVTWVTDETTAKTEGILTFGQKTLSIKTAAVWVSVTDELLEDSVADLPAYIREQFQQAWGAEIDKQVLVASTAPFIGMTKDTSVSAVTMTGNTDFAAVTFQHLLDMENAISIASGEGALQGSVFIMHRKVFNYLRAKTDDMGNPIYQKPADGVPATIYDHPYILSDQMPYTNATATGFIVLGNPRYWVMGARTAVMGDFRVYGDTIYNMQQDQVFFRLRIRAGFVGALPAGFAVLKTG